MDIRNYKIGQVARFEGDYFFKATALPNASTLESTVFEFGKSQSALELQIIADTEIVNAGAITIELLQDAAEDGSFTTTKTIATVGAGTQAIGTVLAKFVSDSDTLHYGKIKITTVNNLAADTVSGFTTWAAR